MQHIGKTLATTSTTSTLFQKLRMPSGIFRTFPGSQGCKCYKVGPVLLIYLHTHIAGVIPAISRSVLFFSSPCPMRNSQLYKRRKSFTSIELRTLRKSRLQSGSTNKFHLLLRYFFVTFTVTDIVALLMYPLGFQLGAMIGCAVPVVSTARAKISQTPALGNCTSAVHDCDIVS